MADRLVRLEAALDEAVQAAPAPMRTVIAALQALRGVAQVSAATIVAKLGQVSRCGRPRQLMSYSGTVASEHSSGARIRRGGITKTGNAHLRRIVIEAAWAYRHRPARGRALLKRQQPVSEEVKAIAWKAQLYDVPVFVLSVCRQTVQRYRRRRPDFVTNQSWPTMLRPGFLRLSHPGLQHNISSIAFIAQV